MRNRWKVAIVLAAVGILAWFLSMFADIFEPHYGGHSLSYWVARDDVYHESSGEKREAEHAIRQIGTNALPLLLKWINYEDPKLLRPTVELARRVGEKAPLPKHANGWALANWMEDTTSAKRANNSAEALSALGALATPILPDLIRLLTNPPLSFTSIRVASVLPAIGTNALPELIAALQDRELSVGRGHVLAAIREMKPPPSVAASAVPVLIHCLSETNIPHMAAETIGSLHAEPDLEIPALLGCLRTTNIELRSASIDALNGFFNNVPDAVEAFTKCLTNPNPKISIAAANVLGSLGSRASEALPFLTNALMEASTRRAASNSIWRITVDLKTTGSSP